MKQVAWVERVWSALGKWLLAVARKMVKDYPRGEVPLKESYAFTHKSQLDVIQESMRLRDEGKLNQVVGRASVVFEKISEKASFEDGVNKRFQETYRKRDEYHFEKKGSPDKEKESLYPAKRKKGK